MNPSIAHTSHPRSRLGALHAALLAGVVLLATFGGACRASSSRGLPPGDWLEETGVSAIPDTRPVAEARAKAVAWAEEDARRKIRAHFAQAPDGAGGTVWEAMLAKPYVWSRVMNLLHETRADMTEELEGGLMRVWLRVDMDAVRRLCALGEEADMSRRGARRPDAQPSPAQGAGRHHAPPTPSHL